MNNTNSEAQPAEATYSIVSAMGVELGEYRGLTSQHAIVAMYRDAGYGPGQVSIADGEIVAHDSQLTQAFGSCDQLVVTEVTP